MRRCYCDSLPDVLLARIFSLLPAKQIAGVCSLVCHSWREAATDSILWLKLCEGSGLRAADEAKVRGGWKSLFCAIYGVNLIASPHFEAIQQRDYNKLKSYLPGPWEPKHRMLLDRISSESGDWMEEYHRYSHWAVEAGSPFQRGGGDGVVRQQPPVNCPPCPAARDDFVIATSCDWGRLQQYVGFQSYSNKFLDTSPPLALTAWFAGERGFAGSFRLYVVFRDELKNTITLWDSCVIPARRGGWRQAKFLLTGYPAGLRSLIVKISGKGNTEVRGFHGTKFTEVKLHFVAPQEVGGYSDYDEGMFVRNQ